MQGKYFLFIERSNQLHRELAPIQVWLIYMLNNFSYIPGKVLGVILVAVYMVAKGRHLLRSGTAMKTAIQKLMQPTVRRLVCSTSLMFLTNSIFVFRATVRVPAKTS